MGWFVVWFMICFLLICWFKGWFEGASFLALLFSRRPGSQSISWKLRGSEAELWNRAGRGGVDGVDGVGWLGGLSGGWFMETAGHSWVIGGWWLVGQNHGDELSCFLVVMKGDSFLVNDWLTLVSGGWNDYWWWIFRNDRCWPLIVIGCCSWWYMDWTTMIRDCTADWQLEHIVTSNWAESPWCNWAISYLVKSICSTSAFTAFHDVATTQNSAGGHFGCRACVQFYHGKFHKMLLWSQGWAPFYSCFADFLCFSTSVFSGHGNAGSNATLPWCFYEWFLAEQAMEWTRPHKSTNRNQNSN